MSSQALLGRIVTRNTALFVCDMQGKFSSHIKYFPEIVSNTKRILDAAKIMKMPIVYTEQYPKGLGHTVPELKVDPYPSFKFEKTQFSMMIPQLQQLLKDELSRVNSVILCGIETHACIRHTTMDLVENGFNVHVVVDACSSRSLTDRYQSTNFYSTTYLLNILNL